jgi:hypothetical protein
MGVLVFGPAVRASVLPLNHKQPCEEEWLSVRWSVLEQGPLLVDAKRNQARERRSSRREAGGPAGPRSGPEPANASTGDPSAAVKRRASLAVFSPVIRMGGLDLDR